MPKQVRENQRDKPNWVLENEKMGRVINPSFDFCALSLVCPDVLLISVREHLDLKTSWFVGASWPLLLFNSSALFIEL